MSGEVQQIRAVAVCFACRTAWTGEKLPVDCPGCGVAIEWTVTDAGIALALVDAQVVDVLMDSSAKSAIQEALGEEGWEYDPSEDLPYARLRQIGEGVGS